MKVEREERGEDNGKGGKVAETWSPGPPWKSTVSILFKEIKEFQWKLLTVDLIL